MIILPMFGTKQGLISAIDRGEEVKLCDLWLSYAHDGVYCYTGAGWYTTVTVKNGRIIKVT